MKIQIVYNVECNNGPIPTSCSLSPNYPLDLEPNGANKLVLVRYFISIMTLPNLIRSLSQKLHNNCRRDTIWIQYFYINRLEVASWFLNKFLHENKVYKMKWCKHQLKGKSYLYCIFTFMDVMLSNVIVLRTAIVLVLICWVCWLVSQSRKWELIHWLAQTDASVSLWHKQTRGNFLRCCLGLLRSVLLGMYHMTVENNSFVRLRYK